jgi:hypothetical protein
MKRSFEGYSVERRQMDLMHGYGSFCLVTGKLLEHDRQDS